MPILSEKERLLRKIQACSFALVEANLYLDSHPTCRDIYDDKLKTFDIKKIRHAAGI